MTTSALLFIHAVTPLHAGVGQGSGDLDLPIARERSTGVPYLPGSSIKGALRALSADPLKLFGPDTAHADDHAGSVQISDARLLLLPIRSMRGVFAYATSSLLLRRYLRDRADAGASTPEVPAVGPTSDAQCFISSTNSVLVHQRKVHLEDLALDVTPNSPDFASFNALGVLLGIDNLASRICIVSDDVMSFLGDTATEVRARIRLDENTRSVAKGGLWYEEALPPESVLVSAVYTRSIADRDRTMVITATQAISQLDQLVTAQKAVQLGGKATVGRGICRLVLAKGAAA